MKLTKPIGSLDDFYREMEAFKIEHGVDPKIVLVHPLENITTDGQRNGSAFGMTGSIRLITEGFRTDNKLCGMMLVRSEDIEPGYLILCG